MLSSLSVPAHRQGAGEEGRPALGSGPGAEFPVAPEAQVSLAVLEEESGLASDTKHARLEVPEPRRLAAAAVGSQLIIGVADQAQLPVRVQGLRQSEVQMAVESVPVVRRRVLEVVGEARDRAQLVSALLVQVSVSVAAVDSPVVEAEVGEAVDLVRARRRVGEQVRHLIVVAVGPIQGEGGIEIRATPLRATLGAGRERWALRTRAALQHTVHPDVDPPDRPAEGERRVGTPEGMWEGPGRGEEEEARLL